MARPAAKKTPSKRPNRPGKNGGSLKTGNPGNAGGSGRPPKAFKNFLAELRTNPDAQDELEKAAKDRTCGSFAAAWKIVAEYDDDKPAKKVEVIAPLTTAEREQAVRRILDREKARG